MPNETWAGPLRRAIGRGALWCFWPALLVVTWGELTPHVPDAISELLSWDKAQHFIAYFGLTGLAMLVWGGRRPALLLLAAMLAVGGGLEILQSFVGRDAEWSDMAANTLGALTGAVLALGFLRLVTLVDARRRH